jgi:hypothetical protein
MEQVVNSEVRELCQAVLQEENPQRLSALMDQLTEVLDERQLVCSLL